PLRVCGPIWAPVGFRARGALSPLSAPATRSPTRPNGLTPAPCGTNDGCLAPARARGGHRQGTVNQAQTASTGQPVKVRQLPVPPAVALCRKPALGPAALCAVG